MPKDKNLNKAQPFDATRGPGKLKVTFPRTWSGGDVTVNGTDANDQTISEVFAFMAGYQGRNDLGMAGDRRNVVGVDGRLDAQGRNDLGTGRDSAGNLLNAGAADRGDPRVGISTVQPGGEADASGRRDLRGLNDLQGRNDPNLGTDNTLRRGGVDADGRRGRNEGGVGPDSREYRNSVDGTDRRDVLGLSDNRLDDAHRNEPILVGSANMQHGDVADATDAARRREILGRNDPGVEDARRRESILSGAHPGGAQPGDPGFPGSAQTSRLDTTRTVPQDTMLATRDPDPPRVGSPADLAKKGVTNRNPDDYNRDAARRVRGGAPRVDKHGNPLNDGYRDVASDNLRDTHDANGNVLADHRSGDEYGNADARFTATKGEHDKHGNLINAGVRGEGYVAADAQFDDLNRNGERVLDDNGNMLNNDSFDSEQVVMGSLMFKTITGSVSATGMATDSLNIDWQ